MSDSTAEQSDRDAIMNAMTGMFDAMLSASRAQADAGLADVEHDPNVVAAEKALKDYDFEAFNFGYLRPRTDLAEALVAKALARDPRLQFLVIHQDFVGSHLQKLFKDHEGNACCADKERTVIRALMRFFHEGTPIAFDYEGEYTYHLPRFILRDHDSVLSYFEGLYRLYHGDFKTYLKETLKAMRTAETGKNRSDEA